MLSVRVLIDSCAGGRSKENENAAAARCMIDNVILTSSERASHDRHSFWRSKIRIQHDKYPDFLTSVPHDVGSTFN